jgi:hypothetical protein
MDRSNTDRKPADERVSEVDAEPTPELEGISPLNPATFPRAEDDEETFAHSPDFHDVPDPGPNVGRIRRERSLRR